MKMSPFSAPFFWGTQKRGLLLPKRAAALWEGTQWCKGGTGKQKTRSCRTQELARSSAQENEWQKNGGLLNREDRWGIGQATRASKAEQRKSSVTLSPQAPQ